MNNLKQDEPGHFMGKRRYVGVTRFNFKGKIIVDSMCHKVDKK